MSSYFLPASQILANGDQSVTLPAPTITTTTVTPSLTPSSSPQQPGSFFSGGTSPPLIAGFISVGAFAAGVISICAWRKYTRRSRGDSDPDFLERILPPRLRRRVRAGGQFGEEGAGGAGAGAGAGGQGRGQDEQRGSRRWRRGRGSAGRRSDDLLGKAKPEMFDVWIEKRRGTVDNNTNTTLEKWDTADSVPLSATLFATRSPASGPGPGPGSVLETTPAYAVAAVSRAAGRDSVEEEDEEKRYLSMQEQQRRRQSAATGSSSSTLRVAVLLQMPSPSSHTATDASQNDFGVQGELAIGLVEAPWTREYPSLRELEGEETGTS